ncbi:MAG TPA: aminotransferase class III-fold pyridoxal phosphate-dependent enzyme [Gaiellaceae bacterium]|nr:aminotransferase class III-fold pyridoxal phosphate-dependent enzyme [Gaiellaceae bacterium]
MVAAPSLNVLETDPPRFTPEEVAGIAAELFGVEGEATDLGSERDQTFLVGDGVLKISNTGEDPAVLDLEAKALEHIGRVDPELPVARLLGSGEHEGHFVRLFERKRGRTGEVELGDDAVRDFGATHARITLALRGFFHPAAGRYLLWNPGHAGRLRPLAGAIPEAPRRAIVERALDRFEERVLPRWQYLPAQVCHGDFTLDNVFLDERDHVAGIVDFGDMSFTARAGDFAIGLVSLLRGRAEEDVFRPARIAIDGYQSRIPLEPEELDLLADLVSARLAALVAISAWRVERFPENAEYIQSWDADSWTLLERFDALGADAVARELGASRPEAATGELLRRRSAVLGSALTGLTYREPVHVVRGEGVWLFDAQGRRYLDCYNNVPVVGHCHPRVTEAVVRQTRLLNTHSRYLYEPLVELAERLVATMPPETRLDAVMLVNSGSEANDLAWRLATTATGHRGAIVTEFAYHGVTTAIADFSPEEWPADYRPEHVETITPFGAGMADAVAGLDERGYGLAATYLDCGFTSDGIWTPPAENVQAIASATRSAGGLVVADEVQAGHGRSGEHLWSFAQYGLAPDVVTLGKPMGNGYPVAAVIARQELFDRLKAETEVFSTFGGNPVAARAALAVLDVIEDERLVEHAKGVGDALVRALRRLGIGEVRGRGLLIGVEVESAERADAVVNGMREAGVLINRTGPDGDVLKIRPPLMLASEHVALCVLALDSALEPE